MRLINAKFPSKCAETGARIKKGEQMVYDGANKLCYCMTSTTAVNHLKDDESDDDKEIRSTRDMVQASEDAYFNQLNGDRW